MIFPLCGCLLDTLVRIQEYLVKIKINSVRLVSAGDGFMSRKFFIVGTCWALAFLASGCAIGVKSTPGIKSFQSGNFASAKSELEAELASGKAEAGYALGTMYLDGKGVAKDIKRAEKLLLDASLAGDPRAIESLRKLYKSEALCDKDAELAKLWGSLWSQKNLVTGQIEINFAPPYLQQAMARIYLAPCEGRERQEDAARKLDSWSRQPRSVYIYVPG
jgi:TPR repeat protein